MSEYEFEDYVSLRTYLDRLVEEVKRENYPRDDLELAIMVAREIASRSALNLLPIRPEAVTVIAAEDDLIINIYTEIERDDDNGLIGFGYAYNLTNPTYSEIGYLYTPPAEYSVNAASDEVH